jgi:nucleotide-binding universal stress UspA family protein
MTNALPTKLLLATDGSEDAELAATTAVAMAGSTDSELRVGPVVPERFEPTDVGPASMEREPRSVLDEQVKKIQNLGGTVVESHLRMGGAAEEVVNLAEELGVGLVMLGSRGTGRIRSSSWAASPIRSCTTLIARSWWYVGKSETSPLPRWPRSAGKEPR